MFQSIAADSDALPLRLKNREIELIRPRRSNRKRPMLVWWSFNPPLPPPLASRGLSFKEQAHS